MTYLFLWLICGVSAFYLFKNCVESNLRSLPSPPENIAQAMRNAAKRDNSDDVSYVPPHGCSDSAYSAVFWTVILVINLCIWPLVLVQLLYWYIVKQDFSDCRG